MTPAPAATSYNEIIPALLAIENGKADVISNRAVLNDNGFFIVEGFKNKRMSASVAVSKLRTPKRSSS